MTRKLLIPLLLTLTLGALLAAAVARAAGDDPIEYAVAAVDGKLLRETPEGDVRLATGDRLQGGATLRTGWFSEADLEVPELGSRFHLGSRTRVRLAPGTPGVLLALDRGRLGAFFDKLLGEEPPAREVETPAAVLAVRGTDYGVAVDRAGNTTLVVFAGVVEVRNREGRAEPVQVEAGFALRLSPGRPMGRPVPHSLSRRNWDRGANPDPGGPGPGAQRPGEHGPPPGSPSRGGRPPAGQKRQGGSRPPG